LRWPLEITLKRHSVANFPRLSLVSIVSAFSVRYAGLLNDDRTSPASAICNVYSDSRVCFVTSVYDARVGHIYVFIVRCLADDPETGPAPSIAGALKQSGMRVHRLASGIRNISAQQWDAQGRVVLSSRYAKCDIHLAMVGRDTAA